MHPKVSILIPAYNSEYWIADTIRSAMAQTWEPKEIIIVDDGSTDRTLAIARQFESEQVCVATQKNQGAAAARNKALSMSSGDYIQWLDSDDLLAPDKISSQLNSLGPVDSRRILLSGAWGHFLYRPSRAHFLPSSLWCDLSPAEFLRRKLGQREFMQTAVWLVSREITDAAGPWDTQISFDDDGEYFCRVLLASEGIRFIPEAKVYYRLVGPGSLSYVGQSSGKLDSLWRSMQLHMRYLRSLEDNEGSRAACLAYLQHYLLTFHPSRPDIVDQLQQSARAMGGQLQAPRLPWKYSWITALFDWNSAKRAQLFLRNLKWSFHKHWDKALFRLESHKRKMQPEHI